MTNDFFRPGKDGMKDIFVIWQSLESHLKRNVHVAVKGQCKAGTRVFAFPFLTFYNKNFLLNK